MRGASVSAVRPERCANALEAITRGTNDGLAIALGVASVLISFIGLMAMADGILGSLCEAVRPPALPRAARAHTRATGRLIVPRAHLDAATHAESTARRRSWVSRW